MDKDTHARYGEVDRLIANTLRMLAEQILGIEGGEIVEKLLSWL